MGLSSIDAVELSSDLEKWMGGSVPPSIAWNYPTINTLATKLSDLDTTINEIKYASPSGNETIAGSEMAIEDCSDSEIMKLLEKEIATSTID